ncbi:MAG TPA: DUF5987 family protein [Solirubrobacterales bacterium]|nr:DUF5987 family protein [Solirubrobacterales bacterium]
MEERGAPGDAIRNDLAEELSRRQFLGRAGALGLGAVVVSALPAAARLATPDAAKAQLPLGDLADGTLQAFFDTIIPGRPASVTELGNAIHPQAIAGVDPEPGAVETDALLLAHNTKIGFDALEAAFLTDLELRSLSIAGGQFLDLDYEARERVGLVGLDFGNPGRQVWEAAAAVPFTAFCAAANVPNATAATSLGYAVMGHPGTAPHGYKSFSYKRRLNRGRTKGGSLP